MPDGDAGAAREWGEEPARDATNPTPSGATMPHAAPSVVILNAFDDEREMYAEYLIALGFDVHLYREVGEALAAAATLRPDVIVTRLRQQDPGGMTGFDVVRRVKGTRTTRDTPIVMISASDLPSDFDTAMATGCDAYLVLPVFPEQLLNEIRRVLDRRPGAPAVDPSRS
jgi:two-component system, cell cycle response regulator DivK